MCFVWESLNNPCSVFLYSCLNRAKNELIETMPNGITHHWICSNKLPNLKLSICWRINFVIKMQINMQIIIYFYYLLLICYWNGWKCIISSSSTLVLIVTHRYEINIFLIKKKTTHIALETELQTLFVLLISVVFRSFNILEGFLFLKSIFIKDSI